MGRQPLKGEKTVKIPVYVDDPHQSIALLEKAVREAQAEGYAVLKVDSGGRCLICGREIEPMPTGTSVVRNPEAQYETVVVSDVCDTCGQGYNECARHKGQSPQFIPFYGS